VAREALYRKLETLLQEQATLIPLFHDIDYRLAGPKVHGLNLRGTAPYVNYPQMGKVETEQPEAEPVRAGGGVLHVPIAGVINSLDPAPADTVEQAEVLPSVYETLTRDAGGARFVPFLAAEYRIEDEGRRYRFRLRDDLRFHDGRRLGARDVRYSYERMLQSKGGDSRWLFTPLKGARALIEGEAADLAGFHIHSASEFSIELEEPIVFFPALISNPAASIVPEGGDPASPGGWVGTGPFRVVGFEPGRRLELERNKGYWRKGFPRAEGLVYSFGVPPKEVLAGFRAGRFALAADLFPADAEALRRESDFASGYRETPRLITYHLLFNAHNGPLADRALRQRVVRAVDVPRLVRQTLGRLAIPASSLIPPGLLGHDATLSRTSPPPSDPPEPPLPAPLELTAAVHPLFLGGYAAFARELEAALSRLGIRIRVVNRTMAELLEAQRTASVDLSVARWSADYPDPDTFVHIVHSREGHLGRCCGSAELDRLIEKGRTESEPAVRHSLYREIEQILAREALMLPLFHEQAYRFSRPEVEGLSVSFGLPTVAYEQLRIRP
jgi:ABC-type oligopeptide transport system substrate-binding subunit